MDETGVAGNGWDGSGTEGERRDRRGERRRRKKRKRSVPKVNPSTKKSKFRQCFTKYVISCP